MPTSTGSGTLLRRFAAIRHRAIPRLLLKQAERLDLGVVGRSLFDGVLLGLAAGMAGAAMFAGFEYSQRGVLEELAGYVPLRADGETFAAGEGAHTFQAVAAARAAGTGRACLRPHLTAGARGTRRRRRRHD